MADYNSDDKDSLVITYPDEQAYLTTALIRSVGLDAMPVRIPAKKHMVTAVRFDGMTQDKMKGYFITIEDKDYMILDTTCKNCAMGVLPEMDKGQTIGVVDVWATQTGSN